MLWLWMVAAFLAYFVKGVCGFANSLVFSAVLGFSVDNAQISPVESVLCYPSNILMTVKYRKTLKRKIFLPVMICDLVGSIVGVFLLKNIDAHYIKIAFGISIVLIGIETLLRERIKVKESKVFLVVIAVLSGLMCGLFAIGALLAAYMSRVTSTSEEFKSNISIVFAVENTFRITLYSILGIITFESLKQTLILIPFMLTGMYLGMWSSKKLDEKIIKKLVIIMLIISGVFLTLTNL